jgi:hypothetical protein
MYDQQARDSSVVTAFNYSAMYVSLQRTRAASLPSTLKP